MYYGEMMAVCSRYAKTDEEAAEILNDSFLKFFKGLKKHRPTISLRAWLRKLVVNTAIDHFRSNKKHYYALEIENVHVCEESAGDVLDALSVQDLLKLIAKLPPSYRLVFNLYAIEGYSHPDIAEKLGINVGTSKSNLSKARKKLQKMLVELEQEILVK